jgi:hypothetical protein
MSPYVGHRACSDRPAEHVSIQCHSLQQPRSWVDLALPYEDLLVVIVEHNQCAPATACSLELFAPHWPDAIVGDERADGSLDWVASLELPVTPWPSRSFTNINPRFLLSNPSNSAVEGGNLLLVRLQIDGSEGFGDWARHNDTRNHRPEDAEHVVIAIPFPVLRRVSMQSSARRHKFQEWAHGRVAAILHHWADIACACGPNLISICPETRETFTWTIHALVGSPTYKNQAQPTGTMFMQTGLSFLGNRSSVPVPSSLHADSERVPRHMRLLFDGQKLLVLFDIDVSAQVHLTVASEQATLQVNETCWFLEC